MTDDFWDDVLLRNTVKEFITFWNIYTYEPTEFNRMEVYKSIEKLEKMVSEVYRGD